MAVWADAGVLEAPYVGRAAKAMVAATNTKRLNITHSSSAPRQGAKPHIKAPGRGAQSLDVPCSPFRGHTQPGMDNLSPEHAAGFDRAQLYSDEGPPLGEVTVDPWAEEALETVVWMLRWN